MSRSPRTTRRSTSRLHPRVESLEARRLFSVAPEVDLFSSAYSIPADVSSMKLGPEHAQRRPVDPRTAPSLPVSPSVIKT